MSDLPRTACQLQGASFKGLQHWLHGALGRIVRRKVSLPGSPHRHHRRQAHRIFCSGTPPLFCHLPSGNPLSCCGDRCLRALTVHSQRASDSWEGTCERGGQLSAITLPCNKACWPCSSSSPERCHPVAMLLGMQLGLYDAMTLISIPDLTLELTATSFLGSKHKFIASEL